MAEGQQQKARSYQLDAHATEIWRLIAVERQTLKQVQDHFVHRYNLYATRAARYSCATGNADFSIHSANMWKKCFRRLELNVKYRRLSEMRKAARLYQECLERDAPFFYQVPGHKPITSNDLLEYARRRGYAIINGNLIRVSGALQEHISSTLSPCSHSVMTTMDDSQVELSNDVNALPPHYFDECAPMDVDPNSYESVSSIPPLWDYIGDQSPLDDNATPRSCVRRSERLIADSDGCIDPSLLIVRAHTFLTLRGSLLCPPITDPDTLRCCEQLFHAVKGSFTVGIRAYQKLFFLRGTSDAYKHLHASFLVACEMRMLFHRVTEFYESSNMQEAWRSFYAGLSYLCHLLVYNLPEALWQIFRIFLYLHSRGSGYLVKTIASHARRWCRSQLGILDVEIVFACLHDINPTNCVNAVTRAFAIQYEGKKQFLGEFDAETFDDYLILKSLELESDQQQFTREMMLAMERSRQAGGDIQGREVLCLRRMMRFHDEKRNYENLVKVAMKGLECSTRMSPQRGYRWASIFAGEVSRGYEKMHRYDSALQYINIALNAEAQKESSARSQLYDLHRAHSRIQRALGNIPMATRCSNDAKGALEWIVSDVDNLEDRFKRLEVTDDTCNEDCQATISAGASQQDPKNEEGASMSIARLPQTPWRQGVTSEDQDMFLTECYDEDV